MKQFETGVHYWPVRSLSPRAAGTLATTLEASGVVDWFQTFDQLVSFYPRQLWRPDVTPMAEVTADSDSFHNSLMVSAIAASTTSTLGITTTADAVRWGPAELLQSMLTLAATTDGKTSIQLGAGELKQCKPFGYRRAQGLERMEDLFKIIRKLLDSDDLISHEGHHWTYDNAWIGSVRPAHTPEFWALGGGPKLIDMATAYADGIISVAPSVFPRPEAYADHVKSSRTAIESHGRDPDEFTFGLWPLILLYDTQDEYEYMLNNPLMKWTAAIFGRLLHGDWEREGIDLLLPANWHYAIKLLPHTMSVEEVDDIISKVTPEQVEKAYFTGTPEEVARKLQPYVDAGANFLSYFDMAGSVLPLDQQERTFERVIEVARIMKSHPSQS